MRGRFVSGAFFVAYRMAFFYNGVRGRGGYFILGGIVSEAFLFCIYGVF